MTVAMKGEEHYSESGFWQKLSSHAGRAGVKGVYAALLLFHVLKEGHADTTKKAIIIGALGYFILPVDLVSDALPAVGFLDDIPILISAYLSVRDAVTPEIAGKSRRITRRWFPDADWSRITLDGKE